MLLELYQNAKNQIKELKNKATFHLNSNEAELWALKIENANFRSQLEDAEEKIEYYKSRIKKVNNEGAIHKFNMFNMPMVNPYDEVEHHSFREPRSPLEAPQLGNIEMFYT